MHYWVYRAVDVHEKHCTGQIRRAINQLICVYPSALPSADPKKDKEGNLNGISVPLFGVKVDQTSTSWCVCEELTVQLARAFLCSYS